MSDVYSDAYLVLAAASAEADNVGFLTKPHRGFRGAGLESREGSGQDDIVVHTLIPHSDLDPNDYTGPKSPISIGPLGKRAWTLQETLLARRCIGFNQYEVAWECYSTGNCECGELQETNDIVTTSKRDQYQGQAVWDYIISYRSLADQRGASESHPRPLSRLQDVSTTYFEWRKLVIPNYTTRGITVPEDRLPALSALARNVGSSSRDKYIAGIWRKDIHRGLAWRAGKHWTGALLPCPSTYIGPSFSWVSINGPIHYISPDETKKDGYAVYGSIGIDILGYDIRLSSVNPYGAVEGGWLKLSALSQTFELRWDPVKEIYTLFTNESGYSPEYHCFRPDTLLYQANVNGANNELCDSVLRATSSNSKQQSFDTPVEGVLILDVPRREGLFACHEVAIMVLGLLSTNPVQYQRIGIAIALFKPESAQRWFESATRKEFTIL
ncbi:hypothetical protein JX265_011298 [Neoarthrinium moseri]|uniref:Heterokaryon incompatibility domain-containing protein n=1 Tax=Neoarthrinium moseri TaxID=1658444 RepID=A0A9Q0AKN8_9PEZI|nr:uncharacterized protein JN550_006334 [Neoarthrinium moseri]KAI1857097.1 hypothetical protein JX265_011298 [Neoarthrinium moseri]KAI1868418.1 hypothetical protein JN550_006334 [Neoarthrinium moseri]